MSEHDDRTYLAWSNSLTRTLHELGLGKPQDRPGNRLQQHLASKAARYPFTFLLRYCLDCYVGHPGNPKIVLRSATAMS